MAKKRKPPVTVVKKKTGKGYQVNIGGSKIQGFYKKAKADKFAKKLREERSKQ